MEANDSSAEVEDSVNPGSYVIGKILDEKIEVDARLDNVNYRLSRGDDHVRYAFLLTVDNGNGTRIHLELDNALRFIRTDGEPGGIEEPVMQATINAIINKMIRLNPDY